MSSPADILRHALAQHGLPADAVVLTAEPTSETPPPPEGPWLVVPHGAQHVVGAVGRGRFATYEALWTLEDATDLAARLASTPLPAPGSPTPGDAGAATARAILSRTERRGGAAGPAGLGRGDLLDCFGPETGHHAYALGTSFEKRSQPPSDVGATYLSFEVLRDLPETVNEGRAAPWFGQPGGGAMVVFDRPLRWYVDHDYLAAPATGEAG